MENESTEIARKIVNGENIPNTPLEATPEATEAEPPMLEVARNIAREAHVGQIDKLGVDYIKHPEAVAKQFEERGEWERAAAAWLHDVVEDTDITVQALLARGIPERVAYIVDLLTRKKEVPDDEYYKAISEDPDALAVKESDMRHNTDPERQKQLDRETRIRLFNKYIHGAEALGLHDFANELRARLAQE